MPKRWRESTIGEPGKRVPLNMRTTATIRAKLEAAAAAEGRSLVQEVEARIERTFNAEPLEALVEELRALIFSRPAGGGGYVFGKPVGIMTFRSGDA